MSDQEREHLCRSHLLGNGPADAYWQHMEDCLTDQPQKTVKSCPELADITQCLGAVFKKVHTVDTVSKSQDQTTCDDRQDQWCKDLKLKIENNTFAYQELLPPGKYSDPGLQLFQKHSSPCSCTSGQ